MTLYCKNNYYKYRNWNATFAFMMSVMKLVGGIFTDVINMYVICLDDTIGAVIGDYVAFGIIAEIDDIVGELVNMDAAAECEEAGFELDKSEATPSTEDMSEQEIESKKKSGICWKAQHLLIRGYYSLFRILYIVIFYYLSPFLVMIIVNIAAQQQNFKANHSENV